MKSSKNKLKLKNQVSEESFVNTISFMMQLFINQSVCDKEFSNLSFLCFNTDYDFLHSLLDNKKTAAQDNIPELHTADFSLRTLKTPVISEITIIILPINKKRLNIQNRLLLWRIKSKIIIYTVFVPAPKYVRKLKSWTSCVENGIISFNKSIQNNNIF